MHCSSVISVYSTILNDLPKRMGIPTFSNGSRFAQSLRVYSEPWRTWRPTNAGAAMSTSGLSTWKKHTDFMPRLRMSARAPDLLSAARSPPCPSGLMKTWPGPSMITFPSDVMPGHMPCVKKKTSFSSRPKYPFFLKHSTVAALLASLVMM